ncbi:dTDP-4-dehydrorhamnose reductase [Alteromonas sp. 5E99-2]|uniref:dTDP-4-dehydrorhamnose reductase n=1 Tax=Alteromonas sp. 5E99-2 TaxID=2817683 RepID=UPI001A99659E|nr:dTDP-4-dehydrorhamnose reductase [Alteromonas sp. 5E99-2]MBO1254230.1 dTDP-4-dehydrorhamnose reductase [Alteromonas sp. 5E99-2]
MNKTLLVIGKSGQLAVELSKIGSASVVCVGRNDIDVMSDESIRSVIEKYNPDALINASAYTAVDKAESEKEGAFALNSEAVSKLANACKLANISMVHVSTDYVFKGDKGSPYKVDDVRDPQGVYGASKAAGEEAIQQVLPESSCIIRTSWVYSAAGNNFVKTMLTLMASKPALTVIDDQVGSPTWAKGLALACVEAATKSLSGVYHWSDEGVTSWYDFAIAIQELGIAKGLLSQAIPIKPIPTKDYPTPASRPLYSVLDKTVTRRVFADSPTHHWKAQLSSMLDELSAN